MNRPRVSVLTPVYKGERFIARTIESILSQSYADIELIIINDGSPDNSAAIIQPYLADPRVKYIEQANTGVASARNTALQHATGAYIGLCDQDDEWLPHKAKNQVAYLETYPEAGMVHGDVDYIDESGQPLPHEPCFPAAVFGRCFPRMYMGNPVMAVAAMFRRSLVDAVGGFDPAIKYADDYDLWLRIAAHHSVGYIDEPVARYRWHAENNSHHQVSIREYTLRVLRKTERELPDACAHVLRNDRKLRYFRLYEQMARYARAESRPLAAASYALRAFAWNPWRATNNVIPESVRNRAAWYWSQIRGPRP
ncbi:MAG: glycosyltransferase [Thiobacillus sp.]|nr:glycosyltransferase [Thiobacillus sp.]